MSYSQVRDNEAAPEPFGVGGAPGTDSTAVPAVPGSTVEGCLRVFFVTVRGQRFETQLKHDATIGAAKAELQRQHGVPLNSVRLIFRGRVLRDEETVSGVGLQDGFVCHAVPLPPASPAAPAAPPPTVVQPGAAVQPVASQQMFLHPYINSALATGNPAATAVFVAPPPMPIVWSPWKARARVWCTVLIAMFAMTSSVAAFSTSQQRLLNFMVGAWGLITCMGGLRGINTNEPMRVRRYAWNLTAVAAVSVAINVVEVLQVMNSASAESAGPESKRLYLFTSALGSSLLLGACLYAAHTALKLYNDLVMYYAQQQAGGLRAV